MREPRNRVVQVKRFGGPEQLEVVDAPVPTAGRGEVRVRVLASSMEYTDVTIRRHVYPWVRRRPPFVMGYDVVGEIDQLGDGVSGFGLLATGAIRPRIAERISFDEVVEAHRRLEAGGLEGKLVLCPELPSRCNRVGA